MNGTPDLRLEATADRFSAAAQQYAVSEQQGGDDLEAIVSAVRGLHPRVVVDIATGPGSTALALAPVAGRVVGTDISVGMIDTARARAADARIVNASFEVAPVENLPFGDAEVDVVTCRIAAHHFADVPGALREVGRVLRPGGTLVLLDSLAPDDAEVASFLHQIETRRDPTHVRAYTSGEWVAMVADAGFTVDALATYPKPKAFEPWLARGGVDRHEMSEVRDLVRSASAAVRTGLSIEYDDFGAPARFADDKLLITAHLDRRPGDAVSVDFSIRGIDHVQLAMPADRETEAVAFYVGVLGLIEVPKPASLAARGGAWFMSGAAMLHLGVEADFRPARKAHPALMVDGLDVLAQRLVDAGHEVRWDHELPGVTRFHTDDVFGNRIELISV